MSEVFDDFMLAGGGSRAGRAFSVQNYGMLAWGDLFASRQKLTLATLSKLIANVANVPFGHKRTSSHGPR
jgi:adenine-specific DNA methylase